MPAHMYRENAGRVHARGASVIEDRGHLSGAPKASGNRYIFSDTIGGARGLVLIGTKEEVLAYLVHNTGTQIDNQIADLPHIYMTVQPYTPGARFNRRAPRST